MRKITMLVALVLISAITFAQVTKQNASALKAVKSQIKGQVPSNAKAIVDSLRYDGDNNDGIGTGGAASFGVYAYFPASYTAAHHTAGNTITSVKLFINGATDLTSATVKIYSDQGVTELASKVFTAVEGWNEVVLTTPLAIPTTDMYIGYDVVATAGYPAGIDGGTVAIPNGNWMLFNGSWSHLTDLLATATGSWNIRAMVDGTALTTPVATVTPDAWAAGDVIVGASLTSSTIALQNVGAGTLTVSGISGISAPFTTTLNPATVSLTGGQAATFTVTYAPTAAGAANQTLTITTNAGPVTVALTGNGIVCNGVSTFPWSEGFEGGALPSCWTSIDADGDADVWTFESTGYAPHNGSFSAVSASYNSVALTPDNYLVTPKMAINSADLKLHFFAAAQDIDWAAEHYSVMVSTTGTATTDFTEIFNETLSDTAYHQITLPLTAYNGQQIYVAFRHWNVTNMFTMKIDDISIDNLSGINEVKESNIVSVFPNPAKDKLFIDAKNINSIEVYNLTGARVASYGNQNSINISSLAQGTYLVKVITDAKVSTQKINIVR